MFKIFSDSKNIFKYEITKDGESVDVSGNTVNLVFKNKITKEIKSFQADVSTGDAIFEINMNLLPGIYTVELDLVIDEEKLFVIRQEEWKIIPRIGV